MAPYLRRCIDSLLAQTFRDFEIILVDDGSTDGSSAICDEYAKASNNGGFKVRAVHQPNAGVSSARNRGVGETRGVYISFIDADDWVEPSFLQAFADEIAKHKDVDLVVQGYTEEREKGKEERERSMPSTYIILDEMAEQTVIASEEAKLLGLVWNKLWRRLVIVENGLHFNMKVTIGEDMLFVLSYLQHCSRIAISSSVSYHYVNRVGSATDREFPFEMWAEQTEEFYRLTDRLAEKWPIAADKFEANQFMTSLRALRIAYHNGVERDRRIAFIKDMRCRARYNKFIRYDGTILSNVLIGKCVEYLSPSASDKLLKVVYSVRR